MEVWGGNGYVETGPMARMYREAPVNSIWEGSGNVMCLDVLRAIERDPQGATLLLQDMREAAAGHAGLLALADGLRRDLQAAPEEREALARRFVQRLVLAAQAALMLRHAPQDIAEAFAASRLEDADGGRVYGTLAVSALQQRILERAWPQ
jgi:putative acyl-CoA dehydrogenase